MPAHRSSQLRPVNAVNTHAKPDIGSPSLFDRFQDTLLQLHDIHDAWEDSTRQPSASMLAADLTVVHSIAQLLETKLATAMEAKCAMCGQLDHATRQLEIAQVDT